MKIASGGTDIAVSGSAYVYYGDSSSQRIRANSSTVFVINDDGDVSSYTGIRSVPDVTLRSGETGVVAWVMDDDGYADAVYIYSENMSVSGGSDDRVYILDDSASALDYATDAALRKALAALPGSLTVFIVSQRAASLQHADQILVLDDGHLVGIGTHDQLRQTCPVYEEIYESQFKKGDAQK